MPDLTPTIRLLQARRDDLAAALAELRLFPRLQEQLADEIAAKETQLASHQEALIILTEYRDTHGPD
jgi:hypothetical protein